MGNYALKAVCGLKKINGSCKKMQKEYISYLDSIFEECDKIKEYFDKFSKEYPLVWCDVILPEFSIRKPICYLEDCDLRRNSKKAHVIKLEFCNKQFEKLKQAISMCEAALSKENYAHRIFVVGDEILTIFYDKLSVKESCTGNFSFNIVFIGSERIFEDRDKSIRLCINEDNARSIIQGSLHASSIYSYGEIQICSTKLRHRKKGYLKMLVGVMISMIEEFQKELVEEGYKEIQYISGSIIPLYNDITTNELKEIYARCGIPNCKYKFKTS